MKFRLIFAVLIICLFTGCLGSTSDSPTLPGKQEATAQTLSHSCWGLWQFTCDIEKETLDAIQLRTGDMHVNVLPFLEPPPLVYLTLEYLEFNGNLLTADIGLRHPFTGMTEFTGFDVSGIFITNGALTGFSDSDLRMAGELDTRLLNPDGYTRWWNPLEFPHDVGILGYTDGLLGTPDEIGNYNCTLNGYKYYADGLGPEDDYLKIDPTKRGMFSGGAKNIRRFEIDMAAGLVFNYAVDACWEYPSGSPPWEAPDSFPPEANRPEAWGVSVFEVENTLWYDDASGEGGGNYVVQIHVYDHFNADLNTVRIESPNLFTSQELTSPTGGTTEYSTYEFDVTGIEPTFTGETMMLITVECEEDGYQGLLPGKPVSAYFTSMISVSDEIPEPEWAEPFQIDNESRMPRACQNHDGDIVLIYHKNGQGLQYAVYDGSWSTPEQAYNTDPSFMHIIIGESGSTTYASYYGWGQGGNDRHALRYQGNPGTWDYMWLWGYTDQPSILLPDDDGSFTHIYTFITGFQIIGFNSWGSGWTGMAWADGYGVQMASTNFAERDNANHLIAYYKDNYARFCSISKSTIYTHPVYTIYQCQSGEDVDSTALAREPDGKLHTVYRVTDASGYRIEYKYSDDNGQTWSSPAALIYDGDIQPLMDYISVVADNNGNLYVTYSEPKWMVWTHSKDGVDWATPQYVFYYDPAPISVHHTQPYLICTGDFLHLFYIDKLTPSSHGMLKYTYMELD
jgi:hypothetical protein